MKICVLSLIRYCSLNNKKKFKFKEEEIEKEPSKMIKVVIKKMVINKIKINKKKKYCFGSDNGGGGTSYIITNFLTGDLKKI